MHHFKRAGAVVAISSLCMATNAVAETVRQHGTHEHGVAQLMIALEGEELQAMLESPAFNLVGFGAAKNASERQHAQQARALLEAAQDLFAWGEADCTLEYTRVESALFELHDEADDEHAEEHEHEAEEDHKEHGDEEHEADEDHGHEEHDEAKHGDEDHEGEADHDEHEDSEHGHDEHEESSGHNDVEVQWRWHCDQPQQLSAVKVHLFEHFEHLETLQVQWIGPQQQSAYTLTPDQSEVPFD